MWELFLAVLVVYTAWVVPFEFGFLDEPMLGLSISDNIVNVFFIADIVLRFFVAYLDKSTYLMVDDRKRIALRYLRTWFTFDAIASVPSELSHKLLPGKLKTYGYFTMLRLWRLRRVSKMFAR